MIENRKTVPKPELHTRMVRRAGLMIVLNTLLNILHTQCLLSTPSLFTKFLGMTSP